jgi:SAM-dependent methyltransferase
MENENSYSFIRYLSAKKSVDDRSLNKTVWQTMLRDVSRHYGSRRLRVLEIGAGIGTMVERAFDWGLLHYADYTAIDSIPENIVEARSRLHRWGQGNGYRVSDRAGQGIGLTSVDHDVMVNFETADVLEFMKRDECRGVWDLLIANAFLDLVDVPATLPDLFALLKPGGFFYFTINFDGATILQPEIDPQLDAQIEAVYHETMDARIIRGKPSGDSKTGRHFFNHAYAFGGQILDAGASDWVVFPGPQGYPGDEAYFLRFLVNTMYLALRDRPELDAARFKEWIGERHAQVDAGKLIFIAHQMDFFGRV